MSLNRFQLPFVAHPEYRGKSHRTDRRAFFTVSVVASLFWLDQGTDLLDDLVQSVLASLPESLALLARIEFIIPTVRGTDLCNFLP